MLKVVLCNWARFDLFVFEFIQHVKLVSGIRNKAGMRSLHASLPIFSQEAPDSMAASAPELNAF